MKSEKQCFGEINLSSCRAEALHFVGLELSTFRENSQDSLAVWTYTVEHCCTRAPFYQSFWNVDNPNTLLSNILLLQLILHNFSPKHW